MNGITRYVLWQLLAGMILVTAGLTCVIWLSQSLRFIEMIVNRGLSASMFVYLTMLLLPNFLSLILPIALFTVVVFTYSRLVSDRELVVMRTAGLSQAALAKPALILALIVVIIGYFLSFYLLPTSYRMFRDLQWDIRYNYSQILLREGAFNNVSEGITVYVRQRASDGQLHGILIHDARKKNKPSTIMAERGAIVENEGNARVIMFDGNRQEIDKNTKNLSILYFDKYMFDIDNSKKEQVIRYREPRERKVSELFNIEEEQLLNKNDYGKFRVEGHNRILSPLMALAFTLIALACQISGSVTRRGQAPRIIAAVGVVIVLQAVSMGLQNLCARNLDLVPLMYANGVIPIVIAYWIMVRTPRRRHARGAALPAATA